MLQLKKTIILFIPLFYLVSVYAVVNDSLLENMQSLKIEDTVNASEGSQNHENNDQTFSENRKDDTDNDKNIKKKKERDIVCKWLLANKKKASYVVGIPLTLLITAQASACFIRQRIFSPTSQLHSQSIKRYKRENNSTNYANTTKNDDEKYPSKFTPPDLETKVYPQNDQHDDSILSNKKKSTEQKVNKLIQDYKHLGLVLSTYNQVFERTDSERLVNDVTAYKGGVLYHQNICLSSNLRDLEILSSNVYKEMQDNNKYYSEKFEFLFELKIAINEAVNKVSKLLSNPDVEYPEKILLEIKQNSVLLAERFDYVNKINFKGSLILDTWGVFEGSEFIDVNMFGDPAVCDLLNHPLSFMENNIVLLSDNIRNKKSTYLSDHLKLIKGEDNIYYIAEETDNNEGNTFSGGWLSKLNHQGDDIVKYIDVPKSPSQSMFIFTEVLAVGSVYVTDYDEQVYRIFLDSRRGFQHDYVNVVCRITDINYKETSSDFEVANVIMFYNKDGWNTIFKTHELKSYNKETNKYDIKLSRQKRSPMDYIKKTPQWIKWAGEFSVNKNRGFANHPILIRDMKETFRAQGEPLGFFYKKQAPNEIKHKASLHAGLLSRRYINYVNKPGRAIVLTYGKNYHSSLLVYDSRQDGPILLSSGGDQFRRTFDQSKKPLLATNSELGVKKQIYEMGLKRRNVIRLDSLNTDKMIKTWENTVQKIKYNPVSQNCAKAASDVLISGSRYYMEKNSDGSIKTTFRNDRKLMMPKDTAKLALEIKRFIHDKPDIQKRLLNKLNNNKDAAFKTKRFIAKDLQKKNSLYGKEYKPSSHGLSSIKFTSKIRKRINFSPFASKSVYNTKHIKSESMNYYRKKQQNKRTYTFHNAIKQRTRLTESRFSRIKTRIRTGGSSSKIAGVMTVGSGLILTALEELQIFVKNHLMYNDFDEHDKKIYKDYLTATGATAGIPIVGLIVRASLMCGDVDCLSQGNAKADNNNRYSHIVSTLSAAQSIFIPAIIREEIANIMTVSMKSYHKIYVEKGITYELHAIPVEEKHGFNKKFEMTSILQSTENKQWAFVVIEQIKRNGHIIKNIVCAGINGQLLQNNLIVFERLKQELEANYKIIGRNINRWISPVYSIEERRRYWNKKFFEKEHCVEWFCYDNSKYSEAEGWAHIRKDIASSKKVQQDYIANMRRKYNLDSLESSFFGYYDKLKSDLTSIENAEYSDINKISEDAYRLHCTALINMIFEGINNIDFIINGDHDSTSFFSKRYNSQDLDSRIKLPMRSISQADYKKTIDFFRQKFEFFINHYHVNIKKIKLAYNLFKPVNKPSSLTVENNLKTIDASSVSKSRKVICSDILASLHQDSNDFFDTPYSITKHKMKVSRFLKSWGGGAFSYSDYLDMVTASQNDIPLGLYILPDGTSKLYKPATFFSFKDINNIDYNTEQMKVYLGYIDSKGNIVKRSPYYDTESYQLKEPIDFSTNINNHRYDHIEYYQDSFSWVTLDPQPKVTTSSQSGLVTIHSLNKTGLYSIKTTNGRSYDFVLSDKQIRPQRYDRSFLNFHHSKCLFIKKMKVQNTMDMIGNKFDGSLSFIRYYHDKNKKLFIPYKMEKIKDKMTMPKDHKGVSYGAKICHFFTQVQDPTKEHAQAIEILLDLPIDYYDFPKEVQKLASFIENHAPGSNSTSILDITTSLKKLDLTTISTPIRNDRDEEKKPKSKRRNVRSSYDLADTDSLVNTRVGNISSEFLPNIKRCIPIHVETSSPKTYEDTTEDNSTYSDHKEDQNNHRSRASEEKINSYYVMGSVFIALAASNMSNVGNDHDFNDLKEIKHKKTNSDFSWLEFSHISTEKTFYSSVNIEEKKMLVLNWHLHRMAYLKEVNDVVKRTTMELASDTGLSESKGWGGFFKSKSQKKSFFRDYSTMGYATSFTNEIEVMVDNIDELPVYLQEEVRYCTIRQALKHFVPKRKLGDFLNIDLPKLSEFEVTEKSDEHNSKRKFLVGSSPWFSVINRLHSLDWYEDNIFNNESSFFNFDSVSKVFNTYRWLNFLFGKTEFDKQAKANYSSMNCVFSTLTAKCNNLKVSEICDPNEKFERLLMDMGILAEINSYLDSKIIVPKTVFTMEKRYLRTIEAVDYKVILEPIVDEVSSGTLCDCKISYVK